MKLLLTLCLLQGLYQPMEMNHINEKDIRSLVSEFIESTDAQEADRLAATLHDQSMQYVLFGDQLLTFTKAAYLESLKAGKVGGHPRTIQFGEIVSTGETVATIKLTASSETLHFHYQIALLKHGETWLITSINTQVERG